MEFIPYFELAVITAMAVALFNMYSRVNMLEEAIDEVDADLDQLDLELDRDFDRLQMDRDFEKLQNQPR